MADNEHTKTYVRDRETRTTEGSGASMALIVGGLVVAVGFILWLVFGGSDGAVVTNPPADTTNVTVEPTAPADSTTNVTIDADEPAAAEPVAPADPAPAEPVETAPAEPAPVDPAAPATNP
jgi:hypothetical protein